MLLNWLCNFGRSSLNCVYTLRGLCLYLRFPQTGQPAWNYRALGKQALLAGDILCKGRGRWQRDRRADCNRLLPLRQFESSRRFSGRIARGGVCGWHRSMFVYSEKEEMQVCRSRHLGVVKFSLTDCQMTRESRILLRLFHASQLQ